MKTDDSFQFARSIKRLRQAIEALGDITGGSGAEAGDGGDATEAGDGGASLALERKQAVILIMKEAFRSYHLAWARSSIEPAFKVTIGLTLHGISQKAMQVGKNNLGELGEELLPCAPAHPTLEMWSREEGK